jgi:hypothetical protein
MAENVVVQMAVASDPKNPATEEFLALVGRCYKSKPDKKDLQELQTWLDQSPELWSYVFNMTDIIRQQIFDGLIGQPAAQKGIKANVIAMKAGMDYDQSPMIEKLLIDNVLTAWMRYQWAEMKYTLFVSSSHSMSEGEYMLQIASVAHRRYLHAVETLARVRRITRATLQVNIAEAGSQQVNIAGDLVKN